ncbi:hypothetical protein [Variovorax sp. LT1R16]|uniref:hypothetical protein n=1 Tax=Variovorax sp. LT1R16 TaxID=3443728 RepID=UPI003F480056
MSQLRKISLTVIEPSAGFFQWQLLESLPDAADRWIEMRKSARAYSEWIDAFNEGFDEVLGMARDGRVGPR